MPDREPVAPWLPTTETAPSPADATTTERLLVVLPSFALGGLRTHALTLAEGAAQAGHRIVLVGAKADTPAPTSSDHLDVREVDGWDASGLDEVAALAAECTGVVLTASPATVALAPRLNGLRSTIAVHGTAQTLVAWLGPRTPVLKALLRRSSGLSVVTPGPAYVEQTAQLLEVPPSAVGAFRNSCLLSPVDAAPPRAPRSLTVVARLALDKAYVLDAGIALAQAMQVPLRVVGTGPAAAQFRERLEAAGLDHELTDTGEVLPAIDEADALVASGIVALEGLTRGRPVVVAISGGGIAGVVSPSNFRRLQSTNWGGGRLPDRDPSEVGQALRQLTPEDLRELQRLVRDQARPAQTYADVLAALRVVRFPEGEADLARTALDTVDELDTRWRAWAEELEQDRAAWRQSAERAADPMSRSHESSQVLAELGRVADEQRAAHERLASRTQQQLDAMQHELHAVRGGLKDLVLQREQLQQEELQHARTALHASNARLAAATEALDAVDGHRQALLTSTSWRVTAPLRAVGHLRRRGGDVARLREITTRARLRKGAQLVLSGDLAGAVRRARLLVRGETAAAEPVVDAVEVRRQTAWPADQPLVTVVIPCFNYGHYVRQAVDSVLAQTLPRVELIVVEGGSTDGTTRSVVQDIERELGGRLRVLYRDGRHLLGDNRNFGFRHARGKYVCSLDADDMLHPLFLEMATYLLEVHGYDVVSTALQCFGGSDEFVGTIEYPTLEDMLEGNYIYAPGVYRREAWENAGGYHDTGLGAELIYEDWRFWQRLLALGARAANFVGQPLFYYRRNNDGGSQSSHPDVPDLAVQRRAVAAFNEDVLSPEALERSRERARTEVVVEDPLVNLAVATAEAPAGVTTVLVALPFMLVGGVERLVSGLMANLPADRYRFVVVTTLATDPAYGDSTSWFEAVTPEVYQLPKLLPQSRWSSFLDYLVTAKSIDVLWLLGSEHVYGELPRLTAAHPDLRVVDNLFNTEGHTRNNRRHRAHIDLNLVENEDVRSWLLAQGETLERVVLTGSGVDVHHYAPPTGARPATDRVLVGYVGRLSAEKNPLAVLDIAEALPADSPVELVVAGGGPLAEDLTREISRRGLSGRVRYLGVLADVTALLAQLDVLLLPSLLDGSPQVVMEAQASGVPVVASNLGGLPGMVLDGRTGMLCPAGDTAAFTRALVSLSGDRPRLEAMRHEARAHAERSLSMEALVQRYDAAFSALLTPSRTS